MNFFILDCCVLVGLVLPPISWWSPISETCFCPIAFPFKTSSGTKFRRRVTRVGLLMSINEEDETFLIVFSKVAESEVFGHDLQLSTAIQFLNHRNRKWRKLRFRTEIMFPTTLFASRRSKEKENSHYRRSKLSKLSSFGTAYRLLLIALLHHYFRLRWTDTEPHL